MADTITILNGLQFDHAANDLIWLIDGEGSANEAVKTYAVVLPPSVSGARVVFNNNYDLSTAMRVHVRVKATKLTGVGTLAKTENTQVIEWTAIAAQAFLDTGAIDVSAAYEATLHIDCAITAAGAHTGTEIIVQVRSEAALNEWSTLTSFIGPTGTVESAPLAGTGNDAGDVILDVTNPVTENLDRLGKFLFIEDLAAIASCEIVYQTAQSGD